MKIGLDFDGIISDCGNLKTEVAKNLFGVDISPDRFKKEILVEQKLLSPEQYREVQKIVNFNPSVGMRMKEVNGALDSIKKLQNKHDLHIVTSRDEQSLEIAKSWMKLHDLDIPIFGVGYKVPKTDALRDSDVFVDDDLDKLVDLQGTVPHLFLFSWGYNTHEKLPNGIKRVDNWKHLVEKIEAI